MNNSLAVYERMNELQTAAKALQMSGYFTDIKSEAQAVVKVMAGAELGLPPFASMAGIHIVQGKPVLGANLIATLVKNDPRYNYRVKQADNTACVLTWYEDGQPVGESSFTMTEANAAGLTNKPTWKSYASDMLFARALTRGARRFAPGIFGGAPVYTPDEMGVETDEDGHIVAGEVVIVGQPQPEPPKAAPPPAPPKATNGTPPQANGHLLYGNGAVVRPQKVDDYQAYIDAHPDGKIPYNQKHLDDWLATLTDEEPAAPKFGPVITPEEMQHVQAGKQHQLVGDGAAEAVETPLFPLNNGAYMEN